MRGRSKLLLVALALLLALYIGSYLFISRRGYAGADKYGMSGFYYFSPEESAAWRAKNFGCVILFWPVNAIDRALGFGRYPAKEPLWRLSKYGRLSYGARFDVRNIEGGNVMAEQSLETRVAALEKEVAELR